MQIYTQTSAFLKWQMLHISLKKKKSEIREMAKDFLQLFAQEMSAFSDVMTLSELW